MRLVVGRRRRTSTARGARRIASSDCRRSALARVVCSRSRLPRTRIALLTLLGAFFLVPAASAVAGTYSIAFAGSGTGSVASSPSGIACSDTGGSTAGACSAEFGFGASVELTATADAGSQLKEWSSTVAFGGTCLSGNATPCTFTGAFETQTITANFESLGPQQLLKVAESGTGAGTVTSSPSGINCGATCEHNFNEGSTVILTASPNATSTFAAWTGCEAEPGGNCEVTLTAATEVNAEYAAIPQQTLTVEPVGSGTGEVTSSPSGIECGSTCTREYNEGTVVTLTALTPAHNTFVGWSGCETQSGPECTVTMSAAKSVSAQFDAIPQSTLTVEGTGTGEGSIASSPSGIDCGATCSAEFDQGTAVTLSAAPASGSRFIGWSGDCSGTAACEVTLNSNSSVAAAFEVIPPPTVSTEGASTVTQTTAIVAGTINGHGAETKWLFNYGPTTGYGNQTPHNGVNAGVISTSTPESTELTELEPNTTYHYQIVAFNVNACFFVCPPTGPNTTFGEDRSFTTLPLPPGVSTGLPSTLGGSTAIVHGSIDPQGAATTYRVEYGTDTSYGQSTPDADAGSGSAGHSLSVALGGLQPDTIYHYRFVATNNGGTTPGEDQTLATYGIAPSASTGAASNLGATTATLVGSLDPQGSDTSYRFQYGTTTNYGAGAPVPEADAGAGTGAQAVSTDLSGLQPSTTYHYRLAAVNDSGVTRGADRTFTTQAGPPPPPLPAPGRLALPARANVQNGAASLGVQCSGDPGSSCAGALALALGKTKLGTAGYSVNSGQNATIQVNLNKAARRLLANARHNRLSVLATATPNASGAKATSRKLTLSEPGRHQKRSLNHNRRAAR